MPKYKFHDLKKRPAEHALPTDVNEQAENVCKRLGDMIAHEELVKARMARKWYGKVYAYSSADLKIAEFEIQKGMVPRYILISYRKDGKESYSKSIHNENLDMSKDRR